MKSDTSVAGADPILEGQRLLAKRRGPVRRWLGAHPVWINIILVICNALMILVNIWATLDIPYAPDGMSEDQVQLLERATGMPYIVANVLGFLLVSIATFYRERWPLALMLAALAADVAGGIYFAGGNFTGIAGLYFFYTLAARRPARQAVLGLAVNILASVAGNLAMMLWSPAGRSLVGEMEVSAAGEQWSFDLRGLLVAIALVSLGYTVIFMMGRSAYRSRMFEQAMLASFEQNKQLATTEERNRIAREMHDVVAHSLTVMVALADGARIVMKKKPERAEEVLAELSSTGRTALADMRRTLGVLRNPLDTRAPLAPTGSGDAVENLSELVESFSSTGLPVAFEHSGDGVPDDANLRLSLYRMTQESLTNVLRYGHGVREVRVLLRVEDDDIYLTIINDGDRLGDEKPAGIGTGKGLVGMKERAAFFGGSVDAGPNDRGGWTVRVHLKRTKSQTGQA